MDKSKEYLKDWVKNFFKNKDAIAKSIEVMEDGKDGVDVYIKKKDKEILVFIYPQLDSIDALAQTMDKEKFYAIIVLNNHENLGKLVDGWNTLKFFKNLTIYFVNPFSDAEAKWVVQPHIHERILDKKSFRTGINAMFETVNPITLEEFERKVS